MLGPHGHGACRLGVTPQQAKAQVQRTDPSPQMVAQVHFGLWKCDLVVGGVDWPHQTPQAHAPRFPILETAAAGRACCRRGAPQQVVCERANVKPEQKRGFLIWKPAPDGHHWPFPLGCQIPKWSTPACGFQFWKPGERAGSRLGSVDSSPRKPKHPTWLALACRTGNHRPPPTRRCMSWVSSVHVMGEKNRLRGPISVVFFLSEPPRNGGFDGVQTAGIASFAWVRLGRFLLGEVNSPKKKCQKQRCNAVKSCKWPSKVPIPLPGHALS